MKDNLGVGVIGVGAFGSLHAKVYSQLDGCELKAVADINRRRLDEVCSALKVEGYTDYRELFKRDDIDAVSICTTDELHVEPALAAANAGKHIFIEKPLALTPEDCDKIIEAAKAADVKLMVGHILRFDPRYVTAYKAIRDGEIGELVHLSLRRNNPIPNARRLAKHTSVLFFLGIHDIDFMNWCVGAKAQRVYAEARFKLLRDTPDTVLAVIRFSKGTIASLEVSWVLPGSFPGKLDAKFEAVGTAGMIYVNGASETVALIRERVEHPELFYAPELFSERVGILRDELAHFLKCVAQDSEPMVGGEEGKAAVEVAYAIQKSFETGSVVEIASS
jgi:UDP-N-acetylglucosamine 3-dehydrogenase